MLLGPESSKRTPAYDSLCTATPIAQFHPHSFGKSRVTGGWDIEKAMGDLLFFCSTVISDMQNKDK